MVDILKPMERRGAGVYAISDGTNGIGVYGQSTGGCSSTGVYADGVNYDVYAVNGTYGNMTGAYEVKITRCKKSNQTGNDRFSHRQL